MLLVYLSLILFPIVAFLWAHQARSKYTWRITGVAFGLVVYPFFAALTLPLVYMGSVGNAIISITNSIAIFHRAPGKAAYFILKGQAPNFRGFDDLWLFALNAILWGIVYGAMGWYVDRDPARNRIKIPLLLLAIPALYKLITFLIIMTPAYIELANQTVHSNDYGTICREVIDAEPNTDVWLGIGSTRNGFSRDHAIVGKQFCSKVELSKAPFQVLLGNPQHPLVALDIPITGGGKTCIGLTPAYKGASPQSTEWSAKVIDCAR